MFLRNKSLLQCLDTGPSSDEPSQNDAGGELGMSCIAILLLDLGSLCSAKDFVPHRGNLQEARNGGNPSVPSAKGVGSSEPEGNPTNDSSIAGETNTPSRSISPSLGEALSPFIFLTIEKDPRKKKCCTRPVAQGVSDKDTFTKLRSTYRKLRPGWLWEPIGVKFYRVRLNLVNDRSHHHGRKLTLVM